MSPLKLSLDNDLHIFYIDFLATGIVILISIAIAAGVVFFLALIGILWTIFARKDEKIDKFDPADLEDDDSTTHRPSSLLEHINAATRTTIIGQSPFAAHDSEKEVEAAAIHVANSDQASNYGPDASNYGPDASNYLRAETPSDAMGGMIGAEEVSRPARARYSFDGAGEGELPMSAGQEVEILDDGDAAYVHRCDAFFFCTDTLLQVVVRTRLKIRERRCCSCSVCLLSVFWIFLPPSSCCFLFMLSIVLPFHDTQTM